MVEELTLREAHDILSQRWIDLESRHEVTEYEEEEKMCTERALEYLELASDELERLINK